MSEVNNRKFLQLLISTYGNKLTEGDKMDGLSEFGDSGPIYPNADEASGFVDNCLYIFLNEDDKKKEIIKDDIRDRHHLMLRIVNLERSILLAKKELRRLQKAERQHPSEGLSSTG
jgi:hypothetical protein